MHGEEFKAMSFFELTNGKKFNIADLQAGIKIDENNEFLKKYDSNNNSIFDNGELKKLQKDLEAYTEDGILDKEEYISWYAKVMGTTIDAVKQLFETGEKNEDDINTLINSSFNSLEEAEAHRECIDIIKNNALFGMNDLLNNEKNSISRLYDKYKNLIGDELSPNEIYKMIFEEIFTADFLDEAEKGELTKSEYVQKKIEQAKALCMVKIMRENLEDVKKWAKEYGIANFNEEKFMRYMEAYITSNIYNMVSAASQQADAEGNNFEAAIIALNNWVNKVLSQDEESSKKYFTNICTSAIQVGMEAQGVQGFPDNPFITTSDGVMKLEQIEFQYKLQDFKSNLTFDETEKLTFDQVFKLERGKDFSIENFQAYKEAESNMQIVSGAYNKLSITVSNIDALKEYMYPKIGQKEYWTGINPSEMLNKKIADMVQMFANYYMGNAEIASKDLNNLNFSGLVIGMTEDGKLNIEFDRSLDTTAKKDQALNKLLDEFKSIISQRFDKLLGDKKLDDYINEFNTSRDKALGGSDIEGVVKAYKVDNKYVIDRVAGAVQTAGMVLTVVGGVLCLTPAAATGIPEAMVALGGNLVVGTMVLEYEAKYLEFISQEEITDEDLEDLEYLNKHFVMDAGGMIVGIKAGKMGNKVFGKLLDKKLTQTLGRGIAEGNRIQAFKEVIHDKELLKNLLKAFKGKVSTDFLISYAGDLAMMGVLGVDDENCLTLLKANLMGVAVGTTSDLAEVERLRKKVNKLKEKQVKGTLDEAGKQELARLESELVKYGIYETKTEKFTINATTKAEDVRIYLDMINQKTGNTLKPEKVGQLALDLFNLQKTNPELFKDINDSNMLKLIEDGLIPITKLEQVVKAGRDTRLSPSIMRDMKTLSEGKSIVQSFKDGTSHQEVLEKTPVGEVAEIGNTLYINDNGNLVKLNISKEKYLELFPPVERFNINQAESKYAGNCWFLECCYNLYQNTDTRIEILNSFRQEGNDIYVKIPGSNFEYKFTNGELPDSSAGSKVLSNSPKWTNMLEYVAALSRDWAAEGKSDISWENKMNIDDLISKGIATKDKNNKIIIDIHKVYEENPEDPYSVSKHDAILRRLESGTLSHSLELLTGNKAVTIRKHITTNMSLRERWALRRTQREIINKLKYIEGKNNYVVSVGIGTHAYAVSRIENGKVYLTNPYNTSVEICYTFKELAKACIDFSYCELGAKTQAGEVSSNRTGSESNDYNNSSDNSGYLYSGIPFFIKLWDRITRKTKADDNASVQQKNHLETNEPATYMDCSKYNEEIRMMINEVCSELRNSPSNYKKAFFSDTGLINRFIAGTDTNSIIFKDKTKLKEYFEHCYNMARLTRDDGYYIFTKREYDSKKGKVVLNGDDFLIRDVATLMVVDPKMHESLGNLVEKFMDGEIDEFSFRSMIHYVKKGYISTSTIDISLKSLTTTDGKKNVGTFYIESLYMPDKNSINYRKDLVNFLADIDPEIKKALKDLKTELGDDFFNLRWECVPNYDKNAVIDFIKDAKNIVYLGKTRLEPKNFQIRIPGYNANEVWLHDIPEISNMASTMLDEGIPFDEVINFVALAYRELDTKVVSKTEDEYKLQASGMLRCEREGYMYDARHYDHNSITPFGMNDRYGVCHYYRFISRINPGELNNPYEGIIDLTRIVDSYEEEIEYKDFNPNNKNHFYKIDGEGNYHYYKIIKETAMLHPKGKYASNALDLVKKIESDLMQKYHGKKLTEADMNDINENIGEIHWILSHSMPWGRGSAGISDAFVKALYKSLGIKLSQPKEGISFDLEAFCTELEDYKKNYKNLYETEPEYVL